jgi:hypothetical protein
MTPRQKVAITKKRNEGGHVVIRVVMSTYELSERCGGKIMRRPVKRLA